MALNRTLRKPLWRTRFCIRCSGVALWGLAVVVLCTTSLTLWLREPEVQVEVKAVWCPELEIEAPVEHTKGNLTFVLVACQANSDALLESIERQQSQLLTAVKSIVYLTQQHVRFIIISNSPHVFDQLLNHTKSWPSAQRAKAQFKYVPSRYPAEFEKHKNTFRPCATQRLFLPILLPEEDAVIYLDSDVIFLRPPEDFWSFFSQMDDKQMAAAVDFVPGYGDRPKDQRYGKDGFNSGLMLLNLTRIRQFPGGWVNSVRSIWENYWYYSDLADQRVLNIFFSKNPSYFLLLGCEWNFRNHYCTGKFLMKCPQMLCLGAKAVHGTSGSFFAGGQLQGVFEFWRDLDMSLPKTEIHQHLKHTLESQDEGIRICGDQNNFINMLTTQLNVLKKQLSLEHGAVVH